MGLSPADLARAAAAEASRDRFARLQRMNHLELRALLAGDPRTAVAWIASAAEHGLIAAQLRLGRMLLEGQGVAKDETAALTWFGRAADRLDGEAMNMVGRCHENGWGTVLDLCSAARWYARSATRGHDWGQYNYGHALLDGRGIDQDHVQALAWYVRAARQGHARAMNLAGRCHEEGWGCARDLDAALGWYRGAALAGCFRGQYNYAALLAERNLPELAAEWFRRAAENGTPAIRARIGALWTPEGGPKSRFRGLRHIV